MVSVRSQSILVELRTPIVRVWRKRRFCQHQEIKTINKSLRRRTNKCDDINTTCTTFLTQRSNVLLSTDMHHEQRRNRRKSSQPKSTEKDQQQQTTTTDPYPSITIKAHIGNAIGRSIDRTKHSSYYKLHKYTIKSRTAQSIYCQ